MWKICNLLKLKWLAERIEQLEFDKIREKRFLSYEIANKIEGKGFFEKREIIFDYLCKLK